MGGFGNTSGTLDKTLDVAISSGRSYVVNDLAGRRITTPIPLIASAQTLTASFAALGPQISTDGFNKISLWLNLNLTAPKTSTNFRVRAKVSHTSGGTAYLLPIYNVTATGTPFYIQFEPEYLELNVDVDTNVCLTWSVENTQPFIAFEVMVEATGATAAVVTTAEATMSY